MNNDRHDTLLYKTLDGGFPTELPPGFCDGVMKRVQTRARRRHIWLTAASVAAILAMVGCGWWLMRPILATLTHWPALVPVSAVGTAVVAMLLTDTYLRGKYMPEEDKFGDVG